MPTPAKKDPKAELVEQLALIDDLKRLTPAAKTAYYNAVCEVAGLDPMTQPFAFITFQGKERLYAKKEATEQLRRNWGVSVTITGRELVGEVYVVTARATMPTDVGLRSDESTGAVAVGTSKGEALANAYMKAETKAKRRVTLSITGLGIPDESEVSDVIPADPAAAAAAVSMPQSKSAKNSEPPVAPQGAVTPPPPVTEPSGSEQGNDVAADDPVSPPVESPPTEPPQEQAKGVPPSGPVIKPGQLKVLLAAMDRSSKTQMAFYEHFGAMPEELPATKLNDALAWTRK